MSPVEAAALASWSVPPWTTALLLATALVYARGWRRLAPLRATRFPRGRLFAFLSGLGALWAAVASPLDAFASLLLSAHMLQHLVLASIAPPLILLGAPAAPLLRGLPRGIARAIGTLGATPWAERLVRGLGHPAAGLLAMATAMWGWHVPAAYELALASRTWHGVEHACFLTAGLLFWWPVVRPHPHPRRPAWTIPLYLLAGDLANTALAAALTFSDRVLYPSYAEAPRLFGLSALGDQTVAGLLMWVPGSLVFLVPAAVIAARRLGPSRLERPRPSAALPVFPAEPFDVLRVPALGRFLRWRHGRRLLQAASLIIASLVVLDGFRGPRVSALNLATLVPWTWARGLLVVALLAAGNLFCMACPFTLPRELARRLKLPTRAWPARLRSKWLAAVLLAGFFWAYEAFDLWDRPLATALLALGYFGAAFAVDAAFRGASFCKYVCPIGQFQFVGSLVSPLEVRVRRPEACAACRTHDCLRGNAAQRGCELELHLPQKAGSVDCTFCLDCVKACPHDAIGILPVVPGRELVRDEARTSVGRFAARPDLALLGLVFAGAAFAAAFAMVRPGSAGAFALLAGGALAAAFVLSPRPDRARLALTLVPLGMGMWAGHWLFHLFTVSMPGFFSGASLLRIELTLLDAGLLGSLYAAWRVAKSASRLAPWAAAAIALWIAGVWVYLQPMPMRGMLH